MVPNPDLQPRADRLRGAARRIRALFAPRTWKARGWAWRISAVAGLLLLAGIIVALYWSREPEPFDVHAAALRLAGGDTGRLVPGYTTTATLVTLAETLLDKPGGFLSNDRLPPSSLFGLVRLLDNIPNWEFGALVMIRDTARVLRNDFSRSQSQSLEDPDLAEAEPRFNFNNDSWLFPPSERQYRTGIEHLRAYLDRLADQDDPNTQFYARADNLNEFLGVVEKRLGSLTQRLNASKPDIRINVDLAGDSAAQQATRAPEVVIARTPWLEVDDVFYEARGYCWALLHMLQAVEVDFARVLEKKNAVASMRQVIRLLEQTQIEPASPMVLNGDPFGWVANYSKTLVSYISPANSAVIDLRNLLAQG